MQTKYINNNSKNLVVFLTGWGCDDNQFRFMKNSDNHDLLICYNYTTPDLDFDFSGFKKCLLIAFSAGVFISNILKAQLPEFEKKIAINGNPLAYNEYFGLRQEIVDIFNGVTKENALDFRRKYLVYDDKEFRLFNKYSSQRSFESCREELASLKSYADNYEEQTDFDISVLSMDDKIFFPQRQIEFWKDKSKIIKLENSAHFPFFTLDDYKKIAEL
jgi:biotin synthesis protein BioG